VEAVVFAVAALACPLGMVVMGWFMAKGARKTDQAERLNVDDLRAEHRRLGAEIERLEGPDRSGTNLAAGQR
jgi:hypothetical protein